MVNTRFGQLPMSFEANQGQAPRAVRYLAAGRGFALSLTDEGAELALGSPAGARQAAVPPAADLIRLRLLGGNPQAKTFALGQLPGKVNYFIGNDPARWQSNVPTFERVKYQGVYPGIDLVYYGNQQQLEYDFAVAPGSNPGQIRLRFEGAEGLTLDAQGQLTIAASHGSVIFRRPVLYQERGGKRMPVEGSFAIASRDTVRFRIGAYDRSRPLVIDPVLSYSTYLGGKISDAATGIAVDSSGDAYVVGTSVSANFPVTSGAYERSNPGAPYSTGVMFVTKLNPTGTALIYSTFIGGSGGAEASGVAIDKDGNAYIAGFTSASNFPVTAGAFQKSYNAGNSNPGSNAVVTELNAAGSALVYSTYLGGDINDRAAGIAVNDDGNAYVVGSTESLDFPTTHGAYQVKSGASANWVSNIFVTEFNTTGTALVYSTFIGGSGSSNGIFNPGDVGTAIALDASGDAFIAGAATSTNFPVTKGVLQSTNKSGTGDEPVILELNPTGTDLVFSTYFGGTSGGDSAAGIAVDTTGVYVTGTTLSTDFPISGSAFQKENKAYLANGTSNCFVSKLNLTGTDMIYSTYLGGSGPNGWGDIAAGIAVDAQGDAYVTGQAISDDFPVTKGAYQTVNNDAANLGTNFFITKFNPTGSALLYSTYLGGDGSWGGNGQDDFGNAIALDSTGDAYVAGQSYSPDFPVTTGAFQTTNAAFVDGSVGVNAAIAKLAIGSGTTAATATKTALSASANPAVHGEEVTFTAVVTAETGTATPTGNVTFSVNGTAAATVALSSGKATYSTATLAVGSQTILASYAGGTTFAASSDMLSEDVTEPVAAEPKFSPAGGTYASAQSVELTDATTGAAIYYTTNGSTPSAASTKYTKAIAVSATETIKAIAIASGYSNSTVASATYTIEKPAATPTFSVAAGTYSAPFSVTLADSTSGAKIYYTVNGTTPTTSSTAYKSPIAVSATETIKAIAVATSYADSAVASASYTFTPLTVVAASNPAAPAGGLAVPLGTVGVITLEVTNPTSGALTAIVTANAHGASNAKLPATVTMCVVATGGGCTAAPSASVTLSSIAAKSKTPVFVALQVTASSAIDSMPTVNQIAISLKSSTGTVLGVAAVPITAYALTLETKAVAPSPNNTLIIPVNGEGAFAVAAENATATALKTITVSAAASTRLPVTITLCQTGSTGQCLAAPTSKLTLATVAAHTAYTFSVFVTASGAISDDSANKILVVFENKSESVVGAANVQVYTN